MEGKAIPWFQELESLGGLTSWEAFVRALHVLFGDGTYDDLMETLMRLRQTTTVEAYKTPFEAVSNRVRGLIEVHKLSFFLSGLREEIRVSI